MGGVELDFTEAVLTSRETVLTAVVFMGGIDVTRPKRPLAEGPQIGSAPQPDDRGPHGQLPPGYPR